MILRTDYLFACFFFLSLLLTCAASLVVDHDLWITLQTQTTKEPLAHQVTAETYSYFFSGPNGAPAIIEFTQKENDHMHDVKRLLYGLGFVLVASFLGCLLIGLKTVRWAQGIFLGSASVLAVLLLMLVLPFESVFTWFHQIFFEPGTWIFEDGVMIRSYPIYFFQWMAQLLWIRTAGSAALFAATSYAWQQGWLHRRK